MRGKDGKSLEKGFLEQFKTVEKLERAVKQNTRDIDTIYKRMKTHYQKIGIVRYDAFQEMGGNLSFVLTMLDEIIMAGCLMRCTAEKGVIPI